MSDQENHDVFSDDTPATDTEPKGEVKSAKQEAETQTEAQSGDEESTQQGDNTEEAAPPAANGDNKVQKSEKMIPEHRHKAAIKDVSDRLAASERKIAELTAQPAPDRAKDPDGHERHIRLETSKTIMADAFPDYNDKIEHFQKMAEANPILNEVVGKHPYPAKMAYDLAKEDLKLAELRELNDSEDFKEFKKWKADKAKSAETTQNGETPKRPIDLAAKVPNLNRNATGVKNTPASAADESAELWKGHHSAA